ncbi:MAG: ABC transporter permease [Planctomycetes bacterium]|jgi:ABC-type transport system involved in multi-copper enzyme maturation permease subunit|nr:ABC transporter permease [Planctomycetota bacterium]
MNQPRPLGLLGTVLESARQTTLRLRGHRVWWWVGVGALILAAASWLLASRAHERVDGRSLFCVVAWWLHGTVVLPWLVLYLGVQSLHGGIEDRTFQYLFLRPVARPALLLGNWLAVSALGAVIGAIGSLAAFVGIAAHPGLWPDGVQWELVGVFARSYAVAAIAYAAAAMLFSSWFRRPLVWAAFFVVGLQQLTANLPISAGLRQLTITDPLRRLILDGVEPDPRLAKSLWPAESEFRTELIGSPLTELAWFTGVCLLLAAIAYQRSEYDARSRD